MDNGVKKKYNKKRVRITHMYARYENSSPEYAKKINFTAVQTHYVAKME